MYFNCDSQIKIESGQFEIQNLEKKRLEIWKEIENLENIWKFEKINLKIWKKRKFEKKLKVLKKFGNLEILQKKLKFL